MVMTGNSKQRAIHDDEAHRSLLDIAACADVEEGIRQGLQDAREGRVKPARQFFEEFEASHQLSPQLYAQYDPDTRRIQSQKAVR